MKKILYLLLLLTSTLALGQEETYTELTFKCKDQIERPFILYTPKAMDSKVERPLLVYLHGAISNPNLKKDPLAYIKKSKLIELADQGEFYLMFCYGQKGATWFDAVGMDMVMGEIREVQEQFNVDQQKIFLSGFSDGASGALYFSMTHPAPFAGFIAMNGSLRVAQKLGAFGTYPANANHKPIYIINTTGDMLYPLNQIEPTVDYLKQFNDHIIFKTPEGNHEMAYLQTEQEGLLSFMAEHTNQVPTEFSWEMSSLSNNTINWISITQIDTSSSPKAWHTPYQLKVFNSKADFGLNYDYAYQGKGLKVKGFKNDTCTSKRMGIKVDDIVLLMEQDTMASPYSPYFYTAKKTAGDPTSLTILREGKEQLISGKFNEGYYYEIFNTPRRSAKIAAKIKGHQLIIHTSNVAEIKIDMNAVRAYDVREVVVNDEIYPSKLEGDQVIKVK
ncbi:MAG: phospholipase [Bacteroidota bacterium]